MRVRALSGLWYVTNPEWREELVDLMQNCLRDPHHNVRIYALGGLVKLNAREKVPELRALLSGASRDEQRFIARAIEKLEGL